MRKSFLFKLVLGAGIFASLSIDLGNTQGLNISFAQEENEARYRAVYTYIVCADGTTHYGTVCVAGSSTCIPTLSCP